MREIKVRILFVIFQAEDGIRDISVTGVQTCALPILQDVSEVSPEMIVLPDDIALREDEQTETQLPLGGRPFTVFGTDGAEVGRLADVSAELSTGDLVDLRVIPARARAREVSHPLVLPIDRVCRSERRAVVVDEGGTLVQPGRTLQPTGPIV